VQVFGDQHGNAIHLFERECSVQRRYQKIIEESPSPSVNEALRERITRAAVAITRAISYSNAGTIEFLLEGEHDFFFLEMNTRIQVEHPVTEMITGVDLVREQILVAAGNPLSLKQHDLRIHGHAIECRVYAEDPARDFLPSPGQMTFYHLPEGEHIRVESGISDSLEVPADYDPMIAKVVVWGPDRQIAMERMERALQDTVVHGIASNVPFLLSLLRNDAYRENRVSTKFCDLNLLSLLPEPPASVKEAVLAYLMWWLRSYCDEPNAGKRNTWKEIGYWRNMVSLRLRINGEMMVTGLDYFDGKDFEMIVGEGSHFGSLQECGRNAVAFLCGEQRHHAWVSQDGKGNAWVSLAGDLYHLHREDVLTREDFFTGSGAGYGGDPGQVTSPMPGKVVKMIVREGEEVSMGQVIAIVEAMKMENTILSPANGTIDKVNVQEGDKVDTSLALVHLSSEESE